MILRWVGQKVRKDCLFDEVLIGRLSDKVTFEQRLKGRSKPC